MYRLSDIVEAFKGLVGWEPEGCAIDETSSESGLFFQEAHPMLTLRAMRSIMPDTLWKAYPEFANQETYAKDAIVSKNDKAYRSLVDNNTEPLTDTASWEEYDLLNDYINELEVRGIKKVVTRFIRDKVIGMETKNIIDRRTLFDGVGRLANKVPNEGKIVGFEIEPIRADGVTMKIEKIGLQFFGNVGPVHLYLFHSSKKEPVWDKEFNYTTPNGTFAWFDAEVFLPYLTDSTMAGGAWYLVYFQNDLPSYMEAINFGRDWSREPCGACNKGDIALYQTMNRFVRLSPFYVKVKQGDFNNDFNDDYNNLTWNHELWSLDEMIYTNTNNYGINLLFSMGCDVSDIMIAERLNFASAVQLQVASDALRALAMNPEVNVNRVQYNADRDNILYETDGNGQGIKGLNGDLEKAYKALSFDTKGLSPVCLSCKNKGIRYGTI